MIFKKTRFIIMIFSLAAVCSVSSADEIVLSAKDLACIGHQIYLNECSGKAENLIFWSPRESFPSIGIGHFIWYPEASGEPFTETFPEFVKFLKKQAREVPEWLWDEGRVRLIWKNREEFLRLKNGERAAALVALLQDTKDLQVKFMNERLSRFLDAIKNAGDVSYSKEVLLSRFRTLASSTPGIYALMDYLNFKGDGFNPLEVYQGRGWGLKQVLEQMDAEEFERDPLKEFADTAYRLLEERVNNSDPARREVLWLAGWKKRVYTYTEFSC